VSTGEIYTVISILGGMLTLVIAFVKAIFKIAHMNEVMERLSSAVEGLTERVNLMDNRMYDNALRRTQKR
jgi:hypothetical protein